MRYKVERSFAWLGNFRRLLIRWEHLAGMYASFFIYAMMRLCDDAPMRGAAVPLPYVALGTGWRGCDGAATHRDDASSPLGAGFGKR